MQADVRKKKLTNTSVPTTQLCQILTSFHISCFRNETTQIELRALKYSPVPGSSSCSLEVISLLNLVCLLPLRVFTTHRHQPHFREEEIEVQEVKGLAPVTQINSKWYRRGAPRTMYQAVTSLHAGPSVPPSQDLPPYHSQSTPSLVQAGPAAPGLSTGQDQAEIMAFSHSSWFLPCSQARPPQTSATPSSVSFKAAQPNSYPTPTPSQGPVCAAHFHTRPLGAGLRQGACNSVLWVLLAY